MLRRRVALALLALIVATAVLLRGLLWLGDEYVEDAALADLLQHEMTFLLERGAGHADAPRASAALRFYRPAQGGPAPPAELAALAPGLHEEVGIGGEPWRVLVREVAPGDRAYLMYLIAFVEQRERVVTIAATAGIAALLLCAWWLAQRIASRALAPLEALVGQIRRLDPNRRHQRLEPAAADDELAVIVAAVNGHLAQLEALVEREQAFAAGASHELRTPLAVIQGSAEQIASGQADARVVERLRRGVRAATEQLEALLALSRTRESPPAAELRLDEWLPAAAEPLLADHGARVRWVAAPARLLAPPGAARIVFGNLLQNALRASPAGEVVVTLAPGCVTVDDNGPGVPADVEERAFEPGFKGREGGSGMGLYIARALAERYGWRLSLRNRPGGGARAEWRFA